jgi:transposase
LLLRYPHLRRLIVVADRGLLSLDNLDELAALKLPGERTLEYILAVPGRRYGEFTEVLEPLQARMAATADEVIDEVRWQDQRLVVAHDPQQAQQQTQARRERIAALTKRGQQLADKLDEQDAGASSRGRKLTDGGARARFFHEVCDARLSTIVKVDLQAEHFTFSLDDDAQARAEAMDGKLALVTNVAAEDLAAAQVVQRYKSLADIERGFRVLKSDLQIAPVFHRLPQRIKAHASLCFLALILHRVMRQRLRQAASPCSPDAALTLLRRVQRHAVSINGAAPIGGVSPLSPEQAAVLAALNIKKPTVQTQLNLL